MKIHFVTGGARSGKSRYAEQLAAKLAGDGPVSYIATAVACDEEMTSRIALHRSRRPAAWHTIESPTAAGALAQAQSTVVLLDCLTLLATNVFLEAVPRGEAEARAAVLSEVSRFVEEAKQNEGELIVVSNEVGSAIVPNTEYGRWFRDILGEANVLVASVASTVTLLVAGCPLSVKGEALKNSV